VRQDWVSLAENPTVEILLQTLADLQQRVIDLEADMVTLRSEHDPWSTLKVPQDLWNPVRQ
jgi:hypothetical protein